MLELTIIILGDEPEGGIRFHPPGAVSHARWMAKAIYALKIFMFHDSGFTVGKGEISGLRNFCLFVVLLYQEEWFTANSSIDAPRQDLQFLKKLYSCNILPEKLLKAASKKLERHLWYLGEELVGLAFFDSEISIEEKRRMLTAVKTRQGSVKNLKRLSCLPDTTIQDLTIDLFVTTNTIEFFNKLGIDHTFLDTDPTNWYSRKDFQDGLKIVQSLEVTNDRAERCVALMSKYKNSLTKDEEQLQALLLNTYEHQKTFKNFTKKELLEQEFSAEQIKRAID